MQRKLNDVVIIGAGPAGLFAARSLTKAGLHVTVLEKEAVVGGKCSTYSDPALPALKTEWGAAVIAPNYGVVLDAIEEKGIEFEETMPTARAGVNLADKFYELSLFGKIGLAATFAIELGVFTYETARYQYARDHLQELPPDFELPFAAFAAKYHLDNINLLMKSFVTGFGYGLMEDCPTYCVMEYIGLTSIPALLATPLRSGLVSIKNGFQTLLERVAEDLDVVTTATITTIKRNDDGVSVTYENSDHASVNIKADALVLAISPQYWDKLGMQLTPVEQACVDNIKYHRYPVAVCRVQDALPQHHFFPRGLEKQGLGRPALFTTRDNRTQCARLGTVYVNLDSNDQSFEFDDSHVAALRSDLQKELQAGEVEVVANKIWEDYMPTLTWALRLKLEGEQMSDATKTLYVGAYTVGGFEDVACVAEQATHAVDKYLLQSEPTRLEGAHHALHRALFFYRQPRLSALTDTPAPTASMF